MYLQRKKFSITKIASKLGVHKSKISREIKRNGKKRSYNGEFAQMLSQERKRE